MKNTFGVRTSQWAKSNTMKNLNSYILIGIAAWHSLKCGTPLSPLFNLKSNAMKNKFRESAHFTVNESNHIS